jgi:hypothetical protein
MRFGIHWHGVVENTMNVRRTLAGRVLIERVAGERV